MKTKTKKFLSLLLTLVLVISAVPFAGFGASAGVVDEKEDGFWYSTYNGGAYIHYYDGEHEELIIPDTLGGCPVVGIRGESFRNCGKAKSISIPATVTEIEKEAFRHADKVTTITFRGNSQLTTIGNNAFEGCGSLTSITLPATVTSIGQGAFVSCGSMTAINVEQGNTKYVSVDGVLFNSDKTELVRYPSNKADTSYTVPASVETIADYAFEGASNLVEIKFEENSQLTTIYSYAFAGCEKLKTITIPKSVTFISALPFQGSASLESIIVEEGNTNYVSIDGVLISKGEYSSIIAYPLGKKNSSYTVPAMVTTIPFGAFRYNQNIVTVDFEENSKLLEIGQVAFQQCKSLTSISLPKSLKYIGFDAFLDCNSLSNVKIEQCSQLEIIDDGAFSSTALTSFTVPANVKTIGRYALSGLETLEFEENSQLEKIEKGAFYGSVFTSVKIPASVKTIEENVFNYCYNLVKVEFEKDNSLTSISNAAFNDRNEDLVIYGYTGKYEETYANENDIPFYALDAVHVHKYVLKEDVAATCTSAGKGTYKCFCGDSYEAEIPAKGHDYGEWFVALNATCTQSGYEKRVCKNDSTHFETKKIDAKGHDYGEWSVALNANCTENGYEKRVCKNDSTHVQTKTINATGHDYGEWYTEINATCTENGLQKRVCKNNAAHFETKEIKATGHNYVNDVCTNCGDVIIKTCSCSCHKTGISGFFWKIKLIFYRIFRTNEVCECGAAHY